VTGFFCGVCLGLAIEESTVVQEKLDQQYLASFKNYKLETGLLDLIAFCIHNLDSLEYPVMHSFFF
jgi:hypothetical protein